MTKCQDLALNFSRPLEFGSGLGMGPLGPALTLRVGALRGGGRGWSGGAGGAHTGGARLRFHLAGRL